MHAFLAFNSGFEVAFGVRWMLQNESELIDKAFSDYPRHRERGGAALWLKRV